MPHYDVNDLQKKYSTIKEMIPKGKLLIIVRLTEEQTTIASFDTELVLYKITT